MPSPFDQDRFPSEPPTAPQPPTPSDWPTQPQWPAPATPAGPPPPWAAPVGPPPPPPPPPTPPTWGPAPGGAPMGPPLQPPAFPHGAGSGAPSEGSRGPSTRLWLVVALVLALVVGAAAGGLASRTVLTRSTDSASAPSSASQGSTGRSGGATSQAPGTDGSGSAGSQSSGSGSTGSMSSWSEVAAAVNPGVVDITSRMPQGVGAGTGMVLSADGEVLTNNHVVEGASEIVVTVVSTGESYRASVVGTDPNDDVAVLRLSGAQDLTTIPIGDSDGLEVGDQVAAIGNAGGRGGTPSVATGRVTALDQQITASDQDGSNAETLTEMIQVDANVVPGDSGGPLVDTSGKVVGMNTAAAASAGMTGPMRRFSGGSGGGEGYAIPINKARSIAEQLSKDGNGAAGSGANGSTSTGGFLGVQVQEGIGGGAEVVGVQAGSPAAKAGLAAGDTIVALDGTAIETADELVSALSDHAGGDQVTVTWADADGAMHRTTVTLASR